MDRAVPLRLPSITTAQKNTGEQGGTADEVIVIAPSWLRRSQPSASRWHARSLSCSNARGISCHNGYPTTFCHDYTLIVSGAGSGNFVHSLLRTFLDLPTQVLTWKTALMLAITSTRRALEMHTLSCEPSYHRFPSMGVTLFTKLSFLPKVPTRANTICLIFCASNSQPPRQSAPLTMRPTHFERVPMEDGQFQIVGYYPAFCHL